MRAVLQRVTRAKVTVGADVTGEIGRGWLVLLGIAPGDGKEINWLAEKVAHLRAFADADGKMNRDVSEVEGSVLVVSQFTLYGDCMKGPAAGLYGARPRRMWRSRFTSVLSWASRPSACRSRPDDSPPICRSTRQRRTGHVRDRHTPVRLVSHF